MAGADHDVLSVQHDSDRLSSGVAVMILHAGRRWRLHRARVLPAHRCRARIALPAGSTDSVSVPRPKRRSLKLASFCALAQLSLRMARTGWRANGNAVSGPFCSRARLRPNRFSQGKAPAEPDKRHSPVGDRSVQWYLPRRLRFSHGSVARVHRRRIATPRRVIAPVRCNENYFPDRPGAGGDGFSDSHNTFCLPEEERNDRRTGRARFSRLPHPVPVSRAVPA